MHGSLSSALTELGGGEKENRYQFNTYGAGLCLWQMRPLKQTSQLEENCYMKKSNQAQARRTPSISASRNYVYKYVYIYFSAAGQARAVGSLESGNLVVYRPL